MFCPKCGTALNVNNTCPACHTEVRMDDHGLTTPQVEQLIRPSGGELIENGQKPKKNWFNTQNIIIASAIVVVLILGAIFLPSLLISKQSRYDKGIALMKEQNYERAYKVFDKLGDFEDASDKAQECLNEVDFAEAEALFESQDYEGARKIFRKLGSFKNAGDRVTECDNYITYLSAVELMDNENYAEARDAFSSLGSFKDAEVLAGKCSNIVDYNHAVELMAEEKYAEAKPLLESPAAANYKDSQELLQTCTNIVDYASGAQAFEEGNYYTAFNLFSGIAGYEDASERAASCKQEQPATSEVYRNENHKGTACAMTISTPSDDERPTFIKIYLKDGTHISSIFIRPGEKFTVKLPAGTYQFRVCYGEDWFGINEMFGDEGYYQILLFNGSEEYASLSSSYTYTLDLRKASGDGNVGHENKGRKDF